MRVRMRMRSHPKLIAIIEIQKELEERMIKRVAPGLALAVQVQGGEEVTVGGEEENK